MASFLGIGLGILLGRRGCGSSALAVRAAPARGRRARHHGPELNVQVESPSELFFGLAESNAADVNFLVLPLVVALVDGAHGALAMPLGPLLRSMPPLRAYAIDIAGSMARHRRASRSCRRPGRRRSSGSSSSAVLAPAAGAWARARRRGRSSPARRWSASSSSLVVARPTPATIWSPYYRIDAYQRPATASCDVNVNGIPHQALLARSDGAEGAVLRPGLQVVPGPDVRRRADRRRRLRHGRRARARAGRQARRRGRDRPGDPADRRRPPPRPPLRGPAGHAPHQRRPGVPAQHATRSTTWSSSRCPTR